MQVDNCMDKLGVIEKNCRFCKYCTGYNTHFHCYQCKKDWHVTELEDTCEEWEYNG
ncbi:MAG: hypothetical protein KBT27_11340 [Prevotellaceae bacterium]|nr:hypothetical protein [Candidatus Faecinaster equi]